MRLAARQKTYEDVCDPAGHLIRSAHLRMIQLNAGAMLLGTPLP
jgi:hypothetical protein